MSEIISKEFDLAVPKKHYTGDMWNGGTISEAIRYLARVQAHFGDIKIDAMFKESVRYSV